MAITGTYISETDLDDLYGIKNITAWSDLEGGRSRDESRIQRAINYAESKVENLFRRSRYAVPFVQQGGGFDLQLKHWMAAYAGDWMYMNRAIRRGEEEEDRDSAVISAVKAEISSILAGQGELNLGSRRAKMPNAAFVVT